MWRYTVRRTFWMIPTALAVSMITFFGLSFIPGDIARLYLGTEEEGLQDADRAVAAFKELHGLDRPIAERYGVWLVGILTGDPGISMETNRPIMAGIKTRLPVTLHIAIFAFIFSAIFGVIPGVIAAVFQDRLPDYFVRTGAVFADSFPSFFLLTLLLIIPAILWGYGPPIGYEGPIWEDPWRGIKMFGPPTLIIGLGSAFLVRVTRSSLLEVLRADYVRTARAKGLSEQVVVRRHAMRNALIPPVTILGVVFANLLNGTIILENVMGMSGLGSWILRALTMRDFNVVMALTMYTALLVMFINLFVDLLYARLDPRIRYQ
jgi:peptide/nickel transport system permease protein